MKEGKIFAILWQKIAELNDKKDEHNPSVWGDILYYFYAQRKEKGKKETPIEYINEIAEVYFTFDLLHDAMEHLYQAVYLDRLGCK